MGNQAEQIQFHLCRFVRNCLPGTDYYSLSWTKTSLMHSLWHFLLLQDLKPFRQFEESLKSHLNATENLGRIESQVDITLLINKCYHTSNKVSECLIRSWGSQPSTIRNRTLVGKLAPALFSSEALSEYLDKLPKLLGFINWSRQGYYYVPTTSTSPHPAKYSLLTYCMDQSTHWKTFPGQELRWYQLTRNHLLEKSPTINSCLGGNNSQKCW